MMNIRKAPWVRIIHCGKNLYCGPLLRMACTSPDPTFNLESTFFFFFILMPWAAVQTIWNGLQNK